jgi:hypothetical protein
MQATKHHYGPRPAVSIFAPFRFLIAIAMALLIATFIVSSTAHAMLLGEASAQSTLGAPLRVVIPIKAAPGDSLDPGCFRIVPNAANASAPAVTARVSLERAAATPRLVVWTLDAVTEPAVQFTLQAGCDGTTRRNYVLLLDPPLAGAPVVHVNAHTTMYQGANPTAREPRQERSAPSGATRQAPASAPRVETLVVQAPGAVEQSARPVAASEPEARGNMLGAIVPVSLRRIAVTPVAEAAPPQQTQSASSSGWGDALTYLAASLAILGVIGLAALFMRQRDQMLDVPEWTRGGSYNGPRSETNLSMAPETLSHTQLLAEATTVPSTSSTSMTGAVAPSSPPLGITTLRKARNSVPDPSMLDSLLGEVDSDEERAVREAFAAARIDVERDASHDEGNAILQAIEDAERDLLLAPLPPEQAAMESSLDDELLRPPRRPNKAAA